MSNQAERDALEAFLDSPWGTAEERDALDRLVELVLGGKTNGATPAPEGKDR